MYRSIFSDRHEAGRKLAERLRDLAGMREVRVLALPRGGVPVAYEIARALRAPLDVSVVRKLGVPGYPELAMGAIASGGVRVMNPSVVGQLGIRPDAIERVAREELLELERREAAYRDGRPHPDLADAVVILVDDGIATGATMRAAVESARQRGAEEVIVAAPVMSTDAQEMLSGIADRVECVATPEPFGSVGTWYEEFDQTTDDEVKMWLARASADGEGTRRAGPSTVSRGVRVPIDGTELFGDLVVPPGAKAIVIFAHGSGSSRLSPRNQEVASALNDAGYATLLFDLLTTPEERRDRLSGEHRFDISLLAERLVKATKWITRQTEIRPLAVGYFGASTGAAAALVAAAAEPRVQCVVSRGGRPDLAGDALPKVRAATLLIVGGHDHQVLALNRGARLHLRSAESELAVIPGATHLFEEPGAMDEVATLATQWFDTHLAHATGVVAAESR